MTDLFASLSFALLMSIGASRVFLCADGAAVPTSQRYGNEYEYGLVQQPGLEQHPPETNYGRLRYGRPQRHELSARDGVPASELAATRGPVTELPSHSTARELDAPE